MTATRLDITIEQGADYGDSFQLTFNPTGYSAAMQVKLASGYPYPILTLTTLNGGLVIDGPGMQVTPVIPGSVTANINPGRYTYDLKLIAMTGRTIRAFEGSAYVSEEVTDEIVFAPWGFLLEDGSFLLLEDASLMLLENGNDADGTFSLQLENGSDLLLETGMSLLLDDANPLRTSAGLMLENGSYLFTENGNFLLLEAP